MTRLESELNNQRNSSATFVETSEKVDSLTRLSENLEASKQEDLKEIERLRKQVMEYEIIQCGQEVLEGRIKVLETELEDLDKERIDRERK